MFWILLSALGGLYATKEIVKAKLEPTAPKGTRFDWDAYWADIDNGISATEQIKKQQRGEYMTTKPLPAPKESLHLVVDIDRYNQDKKEYGEEATEFFRKSGWYMHKW